MPQEVHSLNTGWWRIIYVKLVILLKFICPKSCFGQHYTKLLHICSLFGNYLTLIWWSSTDGSKFSGGRTETQHWHVFSFSFEALFMRTSSTMQFYIYNKMMGLTDQTCESWSSPSYPTGEAPSSHLYSTSSAVYATLKQKSIESIKFCDHGNEHAQQSIVTKNQNQNEK